MNISIKRPVLALLLSSTLGIAEDSIQKFLPIIINDIISFSVVYNEPDLHVESFTDRDDMVIIQESTHLMWVNEPDASKGKCAKVHKETYQSDFKKAKGFCKSKAFGNFAGFSGWRTPTSSELKHFILSTKDMDVNYDAPCNKLMALKNQNLDESKDESYTTITTRYSDVRAQDANNTKPNFGLRCVRSMEQ